jgi:hypothetical protein
MSQKLEAARLCKPTLIWALGLSIGCDRAMSNEKD